MNQQTDIEGKFNIVQVILRHFGIASDFAPRKGFYTEPVFKCPWHDDEKHAAINVKNGLLHCFLDGTFLPEQVVVELELGPVMGFDIEYLGIQLIREPSYLIWAPSILDGRLTRTEVKHTGQIHYVLRRFQPRERVPNLMIDYKTRPRQKQQRYAKWMYHGTLSALDFLLGELKTNWVVTHGGRAAQN